MSQQLVVSNNSGQKLKENVKRDKRKLLKHLKKKQSKNEKKQHTQNKNTLMLKTYWQLGSVNLQAFSTLKIKHFLEQA